MTIPNDNTRAEKDRVFTDPPLTTPANPETAKAPHIEPPDLKAWQEGTGVGPPVVRFDTEAPQKP